MARYRSGTQWVSNSPWADYWTKPSSAQNADLTSALDNSFTNPTTDWSNYSKFANNNNEGGNGGGTEQKSKWEMANTAGKISMAGKTVAQGLKTLDMILGGQDEVRLHKNTSFKDPGTVTANDGSDDDDW